MNNLFKHFSEVDNTRQACFKSRYALLSSANINDRSLLGWRDSELAVLTTDDDTSKADLRGDGKVIHLLRTITASRTN